MLISLARSGFGATGIEVTSNDIPAFLRRVERRLKALDISARAASIAAFGHTDAIRSIRRQYAEGKQKGVTTRTVKALAAALHTTPEWLLAGVGPETAEGGETVARGTNNTATSTVPVLGAVSAGVWRETDSEHLFAVAAGVDSIPADPRFRASTQYALLAQGTSINNVALDGDFLICVDTERGGIEPISGQLVIAVRRRAGNLFEATAKRLHRRSDGVSELRYDSSDPRYSDPQHPAYQGPVKMTPDSHSDDIEVTVKAVVVAVFRPLRGF